MEQLQHPPERVVSAACLSWCDLSEVDPHGSTLFQIRLKPFFPKKDQPGLFTPGEKLFISHKWELLLSKKLPFHYLSTIVGKQRQVTVIITVSPV
jgi:hypothetical protein